VLIEIYVIKQLRITQRDDVTQIKFYFLFKNLSVFCKLSV